MRVIVAGASQWEDIYTIRKELSALPPGTVVIHGDAPGADLIAGKMATELGLVVEPFAKNSEDYRRFRRGAWKGLNERMLASGCDLVLAFHPSIDKSKGTRHLVKLAKSENVEVKVISGDV